MEDRVYKITSEQWLPFIRVNKLENGSISLSGAIGNLYNILQEKLNYTFELSPVPDGKWGVPDETGAWNGMLGMIQRQEVDVAFTPFVTSLHRREVASFTVPLMMNDQSIMLPRPMMQTDVFGFLKPFTYKLWLLLIASYLIVIGLLAVVIACERRVYSLVPKLSSDPRYLSIMDFKLRNTFLKPGSDPSRVVVGMWMLVWVVILSSFSGSLTAMLTVPMIDIKIDSIEDLVNQDDVPFWLETASAMSLYFQDAKDGIKKKVWDQHTGNIGSASKAYPDVLNREYALISDRVTILSVMGRDFSTYERCNIYVAREPVHSGMILSLAFQKNSSLLGPTDYWIQRVKEAGLFDHWLKNEMSNSSVCLRHPSKDRGSKITVLGISSYIGVFFVYIAGITAAALSFGVEICLARWYSED